MHKQTQTTRDGLEQTDWLPLLSFNVKGAVYKFSSNFLLLLKLDLIDIYDFIFRNISRWSKGYFLEIWCDVFRPHKFTLMHFRGEKYHTIFRNPSGGDADQPSVSDFLIWFWSNLQHFRPDLWRSNQWEDFYPFTKTICWEKKNEFC